MPLADEPTIYSHRAGLGVAVSGRKEDDCLRDRQWVSAARAGAEKDQLHCRQQRQVAQDPLVLLLIGNICRACLHDAVPLRSRYERRILATATPGFHRDVC